MTAPAPRIEKSLECTVATLTNVTPHYLGLAVQDDDACSRNLVVIAKDDPLPSVRTVSLLTTLDHQASFMLTITQSAERTRDLNSVSMVACQTVHLPQDLPKGSTVNITLACNENGVMSWKVDPACDDQGQTQVGASRSLPHERAPYLLHRDLPSQLT